MDPTQKQLMQRQDEASGADGPSAGALLAGGAVLAIGGVVVFSMARGVADVGGAMLVLIGAALIVAALWTSTVDDESG